MSLDTILEREADRPAYVRFERRAIDDKPATLAAGHYVSKDVDYALITPPYSKDCVEKKVDKWFDQVEINVKNGRVPQKHFDFWRESYKRWKEGQEEPLNGTSVKNWNAISPAQCKNLIAVGCLTIEDVAHANDEGIRRIGMGAVELKKKAQAWLQAAKDHGPLVSEVTELRKKNEQLEGSLAALQDQVRLMSLQNDRKFDLPYEAIDVAAETEKISAADILPTPAEQYEEKFGKPPHHRMKEATILEKLAE